jgi:hypothetical protein
MRAWLLLVGALGVHVLDEALTNFLDFYNPLVLSIRSQVPWFPMPTFTLGGWLLGLFLLVLVLAGLARQCGGRPAIRLVSWVFGVIMLMNGFGHWWIGVLSAMAPGATSASAAAASVFLLQVTWQRHRADLARSQHAV